MSDKQEFFTIRVVTHGDAERSNASIRRSHINDVSFSFNHLLEGYHCRKRKEDFEKRDANFNIIEMTTDIDVSETAFTDGIKELMK